MPWANPRYALYRFILYLAAEQRSDWPHPSSIKYKVYFIWQPSSTPTGPTRAGRGAARARVLRALYFIPLYTLYRFILYLAAERGCSESDSERAIG